MPPTAAPDLTAIGLSREADLVYHHLAAAGPALLGELSRALGVRPRRVRAALDELADVNAAAGRARGDTRIWSAAAADTVRAEMRCRQRQADLARLRIRRELLDPSGLGVPERSPAIRLLSGDARARVRLAELVAAERREHLVLNPDQVIGAAAVMAAAPVHTALVANQVAIKEVGLAPQAGDATAALTSELLRTGAQFRVLPQVPAKVLIIDRTTALMRVDPSDPAPGSLEITDSDTVARLVELFFARWDQARDLRSAKDPGVALSEREQAILRLLADGHTDKSAAKELGLSARTVAYTVSGLMDRLDVVNRLQLGIRVGPLLSGTESR